MDSQIREEDKFKKALQKTNSKKLKRQKYEELLAESEKEPGFFRKIFSRLTIVPGFALNSPVPTEE
ncbi:MAG: hypothetical protein WCN88_01300 [Candidatus Falkowbacteria bacterium]